MSDTPAAGFVTIFRRPGNRWFIHWSRRQRPAPDAFKQFAANIPKMHHVVSLFTHEYGSQNVDYKLDWESDPACAGVASQRPGEGGQRSVKRRAARSPVYSWASRGTGPVA
jgi:hypothetical protein